MNSRGSHRVIRRQPPLRRGLFAAFVTLFVLWALWMVFDLGRKAAGHDSEESNRRITLLELQLNQSREENRQLRERAAFLEQGKNIDRQAHAQVEKALAEAQSEVAELKQQLNFYQSIVSPEDAAEGVQIQSFALEPGAGANTLRFKLILIQGPARAKRVQGSVTFSIDGETEGGDTALGLSELTGEKLSRLSYDFKYYQNFQGEIALPADFKPESVIVKIMPKGKVRGALEKTYEWRSVAPSL